MCINTILIIMVFNITVKANIVIFQSTVYDGHRKFYFLRFSGSSEHWSSSSVHTVSGSSSH